MKILERIKERVAAKTRIARIDKIRKASLEELRREPFVEKLIVELGLYPIHELHLQEYPSFLRPHCGKGLRIWQYPNQFAAFLVWLSKRPVRNYLEIGVAQGGTLILVAEYLRRFNRDLVLWGVEPCPMSGLLRNYIRINPAVRYIQDRSENLKERFEKTATHFDAAFIDGFHGENESWNDFTMVRARSRVVVFHDITNDRCPGVGVSWRRVRREFANEYDFMEFTEQYPEVRARTGMSFLGMGIAVRKEGP